MNFYSMTIIIAVIIAICYLANLYASVTNWKKNKENALEKMKETNDLLFKIWSVSDDIKSSLTRLEDDIFDIKEYTKSNEGSKD